MSHSCDRTHQVAHPKWSPSPGPENRRITKVSVLFSLMNLSNMGSACYEQYGRINKS